MRGRHVIGGMLAGAAGTAVLDATTYADMLLRGRPPSNVPQKVAQQFVPNIDENRRMGLAALIGYADGFSVGALYGAVRPSIRNVPWFWAGLGLAALTLVLSEGTATAMKQTDPREWGVSGWIADIVPRCLYGWVTATTYDRLLEAL
jgi:hypothetical protein